MTSKKPLTQKQALQICGSALELKKIDFKGVLVCNLAMLRKTSSSKYPYELTGTEAQLIDVRNRLYHDDRAFLRHQRPDGDEIGTRRFNHNDGHIVVPGRSVRPFRHISQSVF